MQTDINCKIEGNWVIKSNAYMMKQLIFILSFMCLFLLSCTSGYRKQIENRQDEDVDIEKDEISFPVSNVLNLKSYSLSVPFQNDSLDFIYGYNYKSHALDCIDLVHRQLSQIKLSDQGESAVMRRVCGLFVHTPDSIWVYDDTQRILLINHLGEVLRSIDLHQTLKEGEQILVNCNYAMSTDRLYYDKARHSLLYGIKDFSTSPATFKVRETFLNGSLSFDYPLHVSVAIPDVSNGDYGNMSDPNISFTEKRIIYNYPVESHIYLIDRESRKQSIVDADSRFTKNKAGKCKSKKDYSQWERHSIENPHFYDVMYLPKSEVYVRLHFGEEEFDATKSLQDMINNRSLYIMFFDKDFKILGEKELTSHRYNYFTGWTSLDNGIILYVDNALDKSEKTDALMADIVRLANK